MIIPPFAVRLESYREILEDRATVFERGDAHVIVVADGAGGVSFGAEAAEAVIRRTEDFVRQVPDVGEPETWSEFLAETDLALTRANDCGITTAIVLAVTPAFLCGASVGDSEAWLVTHGDYHVLTSDQHRKPFVGDGCAADFVPHCATAAYWSWPPTGSSSTRARRTFVQQFASCHLTSRARGSSISLACTLAISMMTWASLSLIFGEKSA